MQLVHTEEVTGSIPVSPTGSEAMWVFVKDHDGSHSCSASRYAPVFGERQLAERSPAVVSCPTGCESGVVYLSD